MAGAVLVGMEVQLERVKRRIGGREEFIDGYFEMPCYIGKRENRTISGGKYLTSGGPQVIPQHIYMPKK